MQNANESKNEPMLPIGETPFWEEEITDDEEGKQLKSVPESFTLLRSLKQSRDRWLYHTFPKFSTKTRGNKAPEITQPAHTIQARGRCNLEIGPHMFPDTILYEVNYLASQVPPASSAPTQNTTSNPYWQSTMTYRPTYQYTPSVAATQASVAPVSAQISPAVPAATTTPVITPSPSLAPVSTPAPAPAPSASTSNPSTTVAAPEPEKSPSPLISSFTPISAITPSLISQVNAAASANPILANLLQLAAAGSATQDQLQTLGLLIQSLAALDSAATAAAKAPQQPYQSAPHVDYYQRGALQVPVKPFDLVIEFRETPGDRWLFPRGTVYAERTSGASTSTKNPDVILTTCLSNDGKVCVQLTDQLVEESIGGNSGLYKATLCLKEAPLPIWDTVFRWIGGPEQNNINKKHLDNLVQPKRFYLGLQLPPGPLLTQVQNASGPSYTMKLLRHGPVPQSRAARNRKPYVGKKNAASKAADSSTTKKPRASQSKSAAPIQCVSCKQTDVPLILGGRYCRPCVDAEKHNTMIPQNPDAILTSSTS